MAITRVEVAIQCDEPMEEGIEVLATIVEVLGLDVDKDVEAVLTPAEDGEPILVAVLGKMNDDDDDDDDRESK